MTGPGSARALRLLILEDDEADAELLLLELRRIGYLVTCERAVSAHGLAEALGRASWDVIVSDYEMPSFDALEALQIIRSIDDAIPVIVVSGRVGGDTAVATLEAGARDFIEKACLERLGPAIERALSGAATPPRTT